VAETLFSNVGIFDGSGDKPFRGEVLVQGNRIKAVARGEQQLPREGATLIDGGGATLMPGLVNGHGHVGYTDGLTLYSLGDTPPEENTLSTMYHAQTLFDHGFTAVVSAATGKTRMDVVIRNEINAGRIQGPRLLAASPELTPTGGLGDARQLHLHHEAFSIVCDGAEEFRRVARMLCREGVDILKIMPSGDEFVFPYGRGDSTVMDEEEVAAVCKVARQRNRRVCAHARSSESVRLCLKCGVNIIHHATYADEATIDLIEAHKNEVFVLPAIGITHNTAFESADFGMPPDGELALRHRRELGVVSEVMKKLHARGVRVLPFGDYAFAWAPHGTDARDFEHFVNYFGFAPGAILRAATKLGGELYAYANAQGSGVPELGEVKAGYLADLIMIDGDPLADLSLFQNKDNILMIMKDGAFHKPYKAAPRQARRRPAAVAE
jgi:imidazolonepropionase-like amidohydrolase